MGLAAVAALYLSRRPPRKKIFVSYDYDRDRRYRYLLSAWDANRNFSFTFDDHSTPVIHSTSAARVKAAITRKLQGADYLLVIVGSQTYRSKWVAWEIAKASELGLELIGVKVARSFKSPSGLLGSGTSWATSFTADAVARAVARA